MDSIIGYCSAPSGSGKTFQIIEGAGESAENDRPVIISQPTKDLNAKTADGLRARLRPERVRVVNGDTVEVRVVNGDTVKGSVAGELTELSKGDVAGTVALSTHQVLPFVDFLANRDEWDVFIDEEPQIVKCHSFRIPENHELITKHLAWLPEEDETYSRILLNDPGRMREIAANPQRDDVLQIFRDNAQILVNRHWRSYVHTESYERLKSGDTSTLTIHSVLKSSVLEGFNSVTMASANFEDSMIFQIWGGEGSRIPTQRRPFEGTTLPTT
jgi:hypothetical protein